MSLETALHMYSARIADELDVCGEPLDDTLPDNGESFDGLIREFRVLVRSGREAVCDTVLRLGDEAGNHAPLRYWASHIVKYMTQSDAAGVSRALGALLETACKCTEYWDEYSSDDDLDDDRGEDHPFGWRPDMVNHGAAFMRSVSDTAWTCFAAELDSFLYDALTTALMDIEVY
jgi:hypothetical protein